MNIVQVAVPVPLDKLFDYRVPEGMSLTPGMRVKVPFGARQMTGVVMGMDQTPSIEPDRLKFIVETYDSQPVLPDDMLALLVWAGQYYQHPVGDVVFSALPAQLRKGAAAALPTRIRYSLNASFDSSLLRGSAKLQQRILEVLRQAGQDGVDADSLSVLGSSWRQALNRLEDMGAIVCQASDRLIRTEAVAEGPVLLPEQQAAVAAIDQTTNDFATFLLNGVTGSGKTEVYIQAARKQMACDQQVLILVPEISLTPQLMKRFTTRLSGSIVSLHSGLNDTERCHNWLLAASGQADIVIGTRSAVFVPLPKLGLIILDEEHDASLKQQDGFRYHARDTALVRARNKSVPVVLGSATPSLESCYNVERERFQQLLLSQRAGDALPPRIQVLDIRRRRMLDGLSDRLLDAVRDCLDKKSQALIFLNRRGYAPTLLCHECGATAMCKRCDSHMTVHVKSNQIRCHHCGSERPMPTQCDFCQSETLDTVGYGTERIEATLASEFPDASITRIDRDSTRRKGELQRHLDDAVSGKANILVGTQMLAKGHHFPKVTLVGIVDVDRGLYGTDYRSSEQLGQLIVQVAGRAGRAETPGVVLLQTRNPDNEALLTLIRDGYNVFAKKLLQERQQAQLPPYAHVALIRAEATRQVVPARLLSDLRNYLSEQNLKNIDAFGPVPAPMEKVGGRYRAQLMVQSSSRGDLHAALRAVRSWFDHGSDTRRIRWSIDVDPVDFY